MITKFRKWCDEYCYEHFDCNLPAMISSNGMISAKVVKQFFEAIEAEFINKPQPRCGDCRCWNNYTCVSRANVDSPDWYCADFKAREKGEILHSLLF